MKYQRVGNAPIAAKILLLGQWGLLGNHAGLNVSIVATRYGRIGITRLGILDGLLMSQKMSEEYYARNYHCENCNIGVKGVGLKHCPFCGLELQDCGMILFRAVKNCINEGWHPIAWMQYKDSIDWDSYE